jgi:surfactin synthase thioesterase subunit
MQLQARRCKVRPKEKAHAALEEALAALEAATADAVEECEMHEECEMDCCLDLTKVVNRLTDEINPRVKEAEASTFLECFEGALLSFETIERVVHARRLLVAVEVPKALERPELMQRLTRALAALDTALAVWGFHAHSDGVTAWVEAEEPEASAAGVVA